MSSPSLANIGWERLRSQPPQDWADLGVPSLPISSGTAAGSTRLAIGPDGEARLLVPISPGDPFPNIGDSQGLGLRDSIFTVSGRPVRFVDLICRERQLESVFQELVTEVLRRLESGQAASLAVEGAVRDFRTLLRRAHAREVTPEVALGLLGELAILLQLLSISPTGWQAWTGPFGARHDFRSGPIALEVKSTLRSQTKTVEISALDQLSEPQNGELFLAFQVFEEDAGGDLAVPGLISEALAISSDPDAIIERLASVGYDPAFEDHWNSFRFSRLSTETYRVIPGFPRLVPSDFEAAELPIGVSHFRYRIDLAVASEYRLPEGELNVILSRVIECLN
jgi:hypothetical protein